MEVIKTTKFQLNIPKFMHARTVACPGARPGVPKTTVTWDVNATIRVFIYVYLGVLHK